MKKVISFLIIGFLIINLGYSQVTVEGIITSAEDGSTLPGVSIIEKGTSNGTVTDINGAFSLQVSDLNSILTIQFVGCKPIELTAAKAIQIFGVNKQQKTESNTKKQEKELEPQTDYKKALRKYLATLDKDKSSSPFMYAYSTNENDTIRLPLKQTDVDVNISGVIANVVVRQVFVNNSNDVIESVYVFPGSTNAAVYAMEMHIGKRILKAKIKEKQEARAIYEQAKLEGRTASLLEQHRPNVFQMDVANILPGDTIIVDFRYTETVSAFDGIYSFVFPRIVGPRYTTENESWVQQQLKQENADIDFDIKVNIVSPIPIKEITCDQLKTNITKEDRRTAELTVDESDKKMDKSDVIVKYRLRGSKVESGILTYESEDENFFLLMMEPPKKVRKEQVPPREYIIIMDVSGSMGGYPIETSKTLLKKLAESFDSTDVFNIVQFAAGSKTFRDQSVAATQANLDEAFLFINQPQGNGGTDLMTGLLTAFNLRKKSNYSTTFIIATDGYVTVEKEAFNFIRKNLDNANVFSFGIGGGVNRFIIEGIAYAGMGEEYIVTNKSEANKIAEDLIEQIKHPVLTNIKTNFKGIEIYDIEPASLHDVFSNRPIVLCGKYKGNAEGKIIITGKSGRRDFKESFRFRKAKENTALKYLWARERIKYLSDYAFYFEDENVHNKRVTDERKQKIIDLGLKYNLLTDYTSFVAVDTMIRKQNQTMYQQKVVPETKNIKIRGASTLNISGNAIALETENVGLEELVVTAYGVSREKRVLGYSISDVNSDLFEAFSDNLFNCVVAGLSSLRGDHLYEGSRLIEINGFNSLMRRSNPLLILNGIPVNQSFFSNNYLLNSNYSSNAILLNPMFINNISVTKSGYATSPYANSDMGVIATTIKEKQYGNNLTINSSIGFDRVGDLPDGISNQNKTLFKQAFSYNNSISFNVSNNKSYINIMASNTKQNAYLESYKSVLNNLIVNSGVKLFGKLDLDAKLLILNQKVNGFARYSGNTGLMYSMLNNTAEQTKQLIEQSKSNFNQNIVLPSATIKYQMLKSFYIQYSLRANLQNSSSVDMFSSVYSASNTDTKFNIDNKMQSVNHHSEIGFRKNFYKHYISANILYDYNSIEENSLFVFSQIVSDNQDGKYNQNYNIKVFNAQVDYMYNNMLAANASYSQVNNELYKNVIEPLNMLSVATGFIYSELYVVRDYLWWIDYSKLSISYDNIQAAPPIFIAPQMVKAESLTSSDMLYTNNLYKAKYVSEIKPENKIQFTLINHLNLFNNMIALNTEFYSSTIYNLFVPVDLSDNLIGNDGEIESKGMNIDLSFNYKNYDFQFDQTVLYTVNRSVVKNISGNGEITLAGIDGVKAYAMNNQPYGVIVNQNGETANPHPDWILSSNTKFDWKGLSLNAITQWKKGGEMWNAHGNKYENASWFKINQLKLKYSFPKRMIRSLKMKYLSLYLFANNIYTFTSYTGVSPNTHFFGNSNIKGIDYYNMPDIKSYGIGLIIKL